MFIKIISGGVLLLSSLTSLGVAQQVNSSKAVSFMPSKRFDSSYSSSSSSKEQSKKCCKKGTTGPTGPSGPLGSVGAAGSIGPTGPTGASGNGTIIPFATSSSINLTCTLNGAPGTAALLGFGSASTSLGPLANPLNCNSNTNQGVCSQAFTVSRPLTVTAISAYWSFLPAGGASGLALNTGITVFIQAQLWQSTTPDNLFTPIADTLVTLSPDLMGNINYGQIATGSLSGLNVPVEAGTRLLFVVYAYATGVPATSVSTIALGSVISGGIVVE